MRDSQVVESYPRILQSCVHRQIGSQGERTGHCHLHPYNERRKAVLGCFVVSPRSYSGVSVLSASLDIMIADIGSKVHEMPFGRDFGRKEMLAHWQDLRPVGDQSMAKDQLGKHVGEMEAAFAGWTCFLLQEPGDGKGRPW